MESYFQDCVSLHWLVVYSFSILPVSGRSSNPHALNKPGVYTRGFWHTGVDSRLHMAILSFAGTLGG